MKYKLLRTFVISLILLSLFCAPFPVKRAPEGGPSIRVGLLENIQKVKISVDAAFKITDTIGSRLAVSMRGGEWELQIKHGKPARTVYRLLALSTRKFSEAQARREELDNNRYPAEIITIGRKITETTHLPGRRRQAWFDSENEYRSPGKEIVDNRIYRVYIQKTFSRKSDAEKYQRLLKRYVGTTVTKTFSGEVSGKIIMKSLDGGTDYSFDKNIKIVGSMLTLKQFSPKGSENWDSSESRTYRGDMEFRIDNKGKLTVINELPVETYLRGVVPAEMSVSFPIEALKAQAVAARSNVIRKIGIHHHEQHFDVCDDEHCQVYRGMIRETAPTDRAIAETQGFVLTYNGEICEATFFSTCGGHTENNENVWSGDPLPYLRGILDSKMRKDLLKNKFQNEEFVRKWLESKKAVKVYCNMLSDDVPLNLIAYAKYFRWQFNYLQDELADIIRRKSGKNLGKIKDIIPMERGVSGRLKKIRIEGTRGELVVEKEFKIRTMLGEPKLYSSCFVIERFGMVGEIPAEFVIKGAGFGHGVGMCQVGAAGMALAKKKYDDILKHYYQDVEIRMIY